MKQLTLRRTVITLVALSGLLAATAVGSALLGPEPIGPGRAVAILTGRDAPLSDSDIGRTILLHIRLPRIVLAALVGATLAVTGAVLQSILRNPLAEPHLIGVSAGAALGVMIAGLVELPGALLGLTTTSVLAFGGGLAALIVLYQLSKVQGRIRPETLVLAGVILNGTLTAGIMVLTTYLDPTRFVGRVVWLMGNLGSLDLGTLSLIGPFLLAGMGLLCLQGHRLTVMTLGPDTAQSLGIRAEFVTRAGLVVSALLIAIAVSVSGMIGFVGIVIPHILRRLIGSDYRLLLPASVLSGAIFLIVADTVARVALSPTEVPVGLVTALCGGPFFLSLLAKRRKIGAA